MVDDANVQLGVAMRTRAQGARARALTETMAELDPALAEWSDGWVFGEVWQRPGLSFEERMLVAIVALSSQNHVTQLRNYLHGALQAGIPADRLREALLMLPVYAGFPTAINAMACFRSVLAAEDRRAQGPSGAE